MDDLEKKINERLEAFQPPFPSNSAAMAKAKVFARTIDLEEEEKEETKVIPLWKYYRVAATIALLIAIPFAVLHLGEKKFSAGESLQTCELPDGSSVDVAEGSEIVFNELAWELSREVELDGEAHFQVAKGEVFTVETSQGFVEVLGTEFTVWENDDALVVHCSEGKVRVESTTIAANEYVVVESGQLRRGKWSSKVKFIESGRSGLSFESTPLSVVVEVLEDEFDKKIDLESTEDPLFSGTLEPENFDESLILLTKPFGLEVAMERSTVVILDPE